jgi:translation initiation factor 2A
MAPFDIRDLQYTSNESHAVRTVGPDIQVFDPSNWSKGVIDKLKIEGLSSVSLGPGRNPSIAVFVGERKVRFMFVASVTFIFIRVWI